MKTFQILSFLLLILSVSCTISSIEDFVVGDNFIKDKTGVVMIDTLTIQTSSVKLDSIISNSSGRLLLGSNYNPFSGYKNYKSFITMKFDDILNNTKFVYDSLCLIMNYDTYYSGDTTVTQTFSIHQLQEEMELNDGYLYSTSQFAYNSVALGSVSLKPSPNSHKKINIRLNDRLGNRLAEMIKTNNDSVIREDLFLKFFKGLVITSQSDVKGAIVGIRTADKSGITTNDTETKPEIRLYYHLSPNPGELKNLYYKFSFLSDGIYFNQISENSVNSLIDGISNSDNERSSKLTNNNMLVQSGIQIFSKIKIPHVDNLLQMGKNSAFIGATFRLYPVKGTYSNADLLPDSMYVYSADRKNKLTGQITLPGSTSEYAYALLKVSKDVEETVYYEVDLGSFIDSELKEMLETNLSLMIGYGSAFTKKTANHVILGGSNSGKYSPKLNVYYYHN